MQRSRQRPATASVRVRRAAQAAHDRCSTHEEADTLRKEADVAQAKFVECKQAADEEHKKHH